MPTYEYRCPEGHEFELFQRMSDDPVATCPQCGKEARRLLSGGGGLLFKGEGFYITDYRSPDYKKKAEAEAGGGAKKEEKGKGKEGKEKGSSSPSSSGGGAPSSSPSSGGTGSSTSGAGG